MEKISLIVTAIATAVIAFYSWRSYKISHELKLLNSEMSRRDNEFKEQIKDLYQGIIISTIISGPTSVGSTGEAINKFESLYKGSTKIFK